ncbi:hypothetical protein [Roseomonas populi]|uniref:Uncharacterized protein n=1 Tax=Roseomonas populi TaxID=3121582 RepID=A0ABT1X175_9PROT|nr:hypothetical protein [Roseomonas pecuniae]MCR0981847.1 hypothetical protein [Roseomonas pecuniae]
MNTNTDFPETAIPAVMPPASPDLSHYSQHVAHLDLSEVRKAELLQAVWQIMRSFVDRAFGDDPAQLCRKAGDSKLLNGQAADDAVLASEPVQDTNNKSLTHAFAGQAGGDRKERR